MPCPLSTGKSKEAEIKRINKELANIRSKFKGKLLAQGLGRDPGPNVFRGCVLTWLPFPSSALGDKALDGYSKKKYVCKLLFIFLLGHDIDFGHMEAVNLLSSNKYTEKQIVSAGDWTGVEQREEGSGPLRRSLLHASLVPFSHRCPAVPSLPHRGTCSSQSW